MVGSFGVGIAGEEPGIPSEPGELAFTAMTCMSMTDFASGIGSLDQAKGASLEQIVIDCDIWEMIREFRRSVKFDDEHFATDLIKKVGPGGTFLKEAHTSRNMRKELFLPTKEASDRYKSYRLSRPTKEIVRQARERAKKILATHKPEPLDSDAAKKVKSVLDRFSG